MKTFPFTLVVIICTTLLSSHPALAQLNLTGTFSGTATDANGIGGPMSLVLTQTGGSISGYGSTFYEPVWPVTAVLVSGTVNGPTVTLTLTGNNGGCPIYFTHSITAASNESITGTYVKWGGCSGNVRSGSFAVTKESPPTITTHPLNRTVTASQNAVFTVVASGNPAPSYQWQRSTDGGANWSNLSNGIFHSGVTTAILTVKNTSTGMSGYRFRTVVSNGINPNATSASATLTVNPVNIPVAVQPSLSGRSFTVDGTTYTSAQGFGWVSGSSHTIATTSPQSGGSGVWYVWTSWSDGGAISHTVAPTSGATYTANFTTAPRMDLAVKSVRWNTARGGLKVTYSYSGPIDHSASLVLFWANGDSSANIIGNLIYSTNIPPRTARTSVTKTVNVEGAALVNPPADATHLVAIIDPEHLVLETQELNNEAFVADVQITYENPDRDESHVSTKSQRIIKSLLRQAGHPNGVITSTYRSAADQARVMFENLINGSSAKYGTYGQMVVDVYRANAAKHTKAWIRDHSEEIITAMTDKIIEIGPLNVSHHAYDPAVLNVIDIGPVISRFTSSAKRRFMCAALDGVESGSILAFYGPQNVPTCKPPVKDPAFHLEIIP